MQNKQSTKQQSTRLTQVSGLLMCGLLLSGVMSPLASVSAQTATDTPEQTQSQTLPKVEAATTVDKMNQEVVASENASGFQKTSQKATSRSSLIRTWGNYKIELLTEDAPHGAQKGTLYFNKINSQQTTNDDMKGTNFPFNKADVKYFYFNDVVVFPEDATDLFEGFYNLEDIRYAKRVDTSRVKTMKRLFTGAKNLKELHLYNFDTSKVVDVSEMFLNCTSLTLLDLSSFKLSKNVFAKNFLSNTPALSQLTLGKDIVLQKDMGLSDRNPAQKWRNVGDGTVANPKGNAIYSASALLMYYPHSVPVDTYVRYDGAASSELYINYVDETGATIKNTEYYLGLIGDKVDIKKYQEKIKGYTFDSVKENISTSELKDVKQSVTLIYNRNTAKPLTINYVDEKGNKLKDSKVVSGKFSEQVDLNTHQEAIEGYNFDSVKDNVSISKLTDEAQSVTFIYSKNTAQPLTINYVNEAGKKIKDAKVVSGKLGDKVDLQTHQADIDGYTFKEVKDNVSIIKLSNQAQSVTFIYAKSTAKPLTINYKDTSGKKIKDAKVVSGMLGDKVDLKRYQEIDGYRFFKSVNNVSIIELSDKAQSVTFIYRKTTGKPLTINYVDETGKKIQAAKVVSGDRGDNVDLETYQVAIDGYTFKEVKDKVSITSLTNEAQSVTFIYSRNAAKPLTINYVDEAGKKVQDAEVVSGMFGDKVDLKTHQVAIKGYTFKSIKDNVFITKLNDQKQSVTFIYSRNAAQPLTINYVDEAGKKIQDAKVVSGMLGDKVDLQTYQVEIKGYTFSKADKNVTELTDKDQEVTLTYKAVSKSQATTNVYRLYNVKSKEHLYTADENEYKILPKKSKDWRQEGVNFKAYKKLDSKTKPVYRVYNKKSGEHLLTADSNEKKVLVSRGWSDEGIAFYTLKSGGKGVYRVYNPKAGIGAHMLTGDKNEVDTLGKRGWKNEGIKFYSAE